ncbi:hypothetical protein B5D77_02310 [Microcystis sp. MC19]|nr:MULTISPECIES: hypothetical protein [Microcystis]AVQ70324.1 hypothetical protein B5D77_02310 [Microcystis sp. MC19]
MVNYPLFYIRTIDLSVLCVSVVRSTNSPRRLYLRIHFIHQTWESRIDFREKTILKIISRSALDL